MFCHNILTPSHVCFDQDQHLTCNGNSLILHYILMEIIFLILFIIFENIQVNDQFDSIDDNQIQDYVNYLEDESESNTP